MLRHLPSTPTAIIRQQATPNAVERTRFPRPTTRNLGSRRRGRDRLTHPALRAIHVSRGVQMVRCLRPWAPSKFPPGFLGRLILRLVLEFLEIDRVGSKCGVQTEVDDGRLDHPVSEVVPRSFGDHLASNQTLGRARPTGQVS